MNTIHLSIITPARQIYEQEVNRIVIPTKSGEITVHPNHIPLISALATGEIRVITKDDTTVPFAVSRGVLEVRPNSKVVILADDSEPAKEINIEQAEAAYQRAKEFLESKKDISDVDYARFQTLLEKSLNKVQIARKYRR